jgi:hypothetical protein
VAAITYPQPGSTFVVGQEIAIQSVSVDPDNRGLSRVDVLVDGEVIGSQAATPGVTSYAAGQTWRPTAPGTHLIEVRAYNLAGLASDPAQANITVSEAVAQPSPQPLPSQVSPGEPTLTALVTVNVRAGPGVDYPAIGGLSAGQTAPVTGINPEGTWWQIVYPPNSEGRGWVTGGAQYTRADLTRVVPAVEGQPLSAFPPPPPPCQMVVFDFLALAPVAAWYNSYGEVLPFPGELWDTDGFALYPGDFRVEDGGAPPIMLMTNPPDFGTINGDYILYFPIQPGDAFRSVVGFLFEAYAGNARWVLSYKDLGAVSCPICGVGVLAQMDKYYTGQLIPFEVELSPLAGRQVVLTLSVLSNGPWDYDWAVWLYPRIERPCR